MCMCMWNLMCLCHHVDVPTPPSRQSPADNHRPVGRADHHDRGQRTNAGSSDPDAPRRSCARVRRGGDAPAVAGSQGARDGAHVLLEHNDWWVEAHRAPPLAPPTRPLGRAVRTHPACVSCSWPWRRRCATPPSSAGVPRSAHVHGHAVDCCPTPLSPILPPPPLLTRTAPIAARAHWQAASCGAAPRPRTAC